MCTSLRLNQHTPLECKLLSQYTCVSSLRTRLGYVPSLGWQTCKYYYFSKQVWLSLQAITGHAVNGHQMGLDLRLKEKMFLEHHSPLTCAGLGSISIMPCSMAGNTYVQQPIMTKHHQQRHSCNMTAASCIWSLICITRMAPTATALL